MQANFFKKLYEQNDIKLTLANLTFRRRWSCGPVMAALGTFLLESRVPAKFRRMNRYCVSFLTADPNDLRWAGHELRPMTWMVDALGSHWPAVIRAGITKRTFTLVSWLCLHVGYCGVWEEGNGDWE